MFLIGDAEESLKEKWKTRKYLKFLKIGASSSSSGGNRSGSSTNNRRSSRTMTATITKKERMKCKKESRNYERRRQFGRIIKLIEDYDDDYLE